MKLSLITVTHKRPHQLQKILLPSILSQTNQDFEWVVINDGGEQATKEIVAATHSKIEIKYFDTHHVGLCAARNLGLEKATGELVGFIDDDNSIYPDFVDKMTSLFHQNPKIAMAMPIQDRRRDVYQNGILVKRGKDFVSPLPNSSDEDFIQGKALFDSNGFVHRRNNELKFNEHLLILSDYEYLLRCFSEFGLGSFLIYPEHLVKYIQTNEGIIGKSKYQDWLKELEYIWQNKIAYKIFSIINPALWMPERIDKLKKKVINQEKLPGFIV